MPGEEEEGVGGIANPRLASEGLEACLFAPEVVGMGSKTKEAPPKPPAKEPRVAPGKETPAAAPRDKKSRPADEEDAKAGKEEDVHTCCACRFPLLVALLQLILGVSITVLAFLMAEFSPSLLLRETPYWAGALVSIPGYGLEGEAGVSAAPTSARSVCMRYSAPGSAGKGWWA